MSKIPFWLQVHCRDCGLLIMDCMCKPIPCPFCDDVYFGFIQDWNIHLVGQHRIRNSEYKLSPRSVQTPEAKTPVATR